MRLPYTDPSVCRSSHPARSTLALLIALAAVVAPHAVARASCSTPPFELLWTYPADGAADVPINADFWFLTSTWGAMPEATLNGIALDEATAVSFGGSTIDPGMLEPNTDYVLVLEYPDTDSVLADGGMVGAIEITFRTGAGTAATPAAPTVADHSAVMSIPNDHACPKVIEAQDCFDEGQNTLVSFNASDGDAIAWVVRGMTGGPRALWPEECGAPSVFTDDPAGASICYFVSMIGAGGIVGDETHYCTPASAVDAGASDGGAVNMGERDAAVSGGADAEVAGAAPDSSVDRSDSEPTGHDDAGAANGPTGSSIETSGCSVSARDLASSSASNDTLVDFSALALLALAFRRARSKR